MNIFFSLLFFFSSNLLAKELVLKCENSYSFKFSNFNTDNKVSSYKFNDEDWIEIKQFKVKDNTVELFIPNMQYLACADDNLPVCRYSILISDLTNHRPKFTELVLNDCFIGTMGCNEYSKGLNLNQSFCQVK